MTLSFCEYMATDCCRGFLDKLGQPVESLELARYVLVEIEDHIVQLLVDRNQFGETIYKSH